jgi:hypothetical protein
MSATNASFEAPRKSAAPQDEGHYRFGNFAFSA